MSLKKIKPLEGGLEPPTLWLTATRSNQLSYSSYWCTFEVDLFIFSIDDNLGVATNFGHFAYHT